MLSACIDLDHVSAGEVEREQKAWQHCFGFDHVTAVEIEILLDLHTYLDLIVHLGAPN